MEKITIKDNIADDQPDSTCDKLLNEVSATKSKRHRGSFAESLKIQCTHITHHKDGSLTQCPALAFVKKDNEALCSVHANTRKLDDVQKQKKRESCLMFYYKLKHKAAQGDQGAIDRLNKIRERSLKYYHDKRDKQNQENVKAIETISPEDLIAMLKRNAKAIEEVIESLKAEKQEKTTSSV